MCDQDSHFWMGGIHASNCVEVTNNPDHLDDGSFWAVSISFEGEKTFLRFADVTQQEFPSSTWEKLSGRWISSQSERDYIAYVEQIRQTISEGGVYQVNACRELNLLLQKKEQSLAGLFSNLLIENPAHYACYIKADGLEVASASPERFLSRKGSTILTSPIKGTIRSDEDTFGEKDKAENMMIVDLMRNDLGQICVPGSIEVSELFRHEKHPGITHLVSDVQGTIAKETSWAEILDATLPPGSVSGAPKSSALSIISTHEGARGPYCGTMGWIHGDRAELSVAIRTFWTTGDGFLRFGTGAGITWGSDSAAEWAETQLKARHLISIAGGEL